jgi:hypothetical protein
MDSEIKKEDLVQENMPTPGQEKPDEPDVEELVYIFEPSPRLKFEPTKGRRQYYMTRSKRNSRR